MADHGSGALLALAGGLYTHLARTQVDRGLGRAVEAPAGGQFSKVPAQTKTLGRGIGPSSMSRPLQWDGDSWVEIA